MITDERLRSMENRALRRLAGDWSADYCEDVPDLVAEVRRLQQDLAEQRSLTAIYGQIAHDVTSGWDAVERHRKALADFGIYPGSPAPR